MGLCLESTPEMELWTVETRRESFILSGPGEDDWIEVLYTDIPKIRAALDLAEQNKR